MEIYILFDLMLVLIRLDFCFMLWFFLLGFLEFLEQLIETDLEIEGKKKMMIWKWESARGRKQRHG